MNRIGIQGAIGSYSEMAAFDFFQKGHGKNLNFSPTIITFDHSEEVAQALEEKKIDFGFFPIENSIIGTIDRGARTWRTCAPPACAA
jgi:prephenate dehydratase